MWIALIIIVAMVGLFLFIKKTGEQAIQVDKEGGMRNKYRELIHILLSEDTRSVIFKETSISVTLGLANSGGTSLFILTQCYGELHVEWQVKSPVFGNHDLEWKFDQYANQEEMAGKILHDATKYQQNVMESMGLPGPLDY